MATTEDKQFIDGSEEVSETNLNAEQEDRQTEESEVTGKIPSGEWHTSGSGHGTDTHQVRSKHSRTTSEVEKSSTTRKDTLGSRTPTSRRCSRRKRLTDSSMRRNRVSAEPKPWPSADYNT